MTRTTHVAVAITTSLAYSILVSVQGVEVVAGAVCSCMIPDIDQKIKWLGHRRQTHSILFLAMFWLLWMLYPSGVTIGMIMGIWSHMAIDMLNSKGIELYYPFNTKNYSLCSLKYNGIGEKIIRYVSVGASLGMIGLLGKNMIGGLI